MIITVATIAEITAKMDAPESMQQSRRIYFFLDEINMIFHKDIQRCTDRTTVCIPILFLSSSQSFIHSL